MGERNIINGVASTAIITELNGFFLQTKWVLILALFIILADLRFGIKAAKVRGESVKRSRAIRRTINKMIDYICWIAVSFAIGECFGEPFGIDILPMLVLLVIYGIEIESIFANYFEYRGKKIRVNFLKFFGKKTEIIEIEENEIEGKNTD